MNRSTFLKALAVLPFVELPEVEPEKPITDLHLRAAIEAEMRYADAFAGEDWQMVGDPLDYYYKALYDLERQRTP